MGSSSFVEEDGLSSIKGSLSIAVAEKETVLPAEKRHMSEEILQKTDKPLLGYQSWLCCQIRSLEEDWKIC
jgi:hypothetical protein